ncbi:MAG TPA: arylsulfotransferase family protein [Streptosporangiaceae bacterium]|nr:arylsulfotransferase family protein [Streptosporangiaceae bacterium]
MAGEVTRRRLFGQAGGAAVGLAGLGVVGGCAGSQAADTSETGGLQVGQIVPDHFERGGYHQFITRPDLHPPVIKMARRAQGSFATPIFMNAPYSGPGFGGSMIVDSHGDIIWMGRDTPTAHRLDFNMQMYKGSPHLTWWEGVETHGWGQGVAVVADSSYRRLHTIHAHGKDLKLDHHEFTVTAENTALVTIYKTHTGVDLRKVGGPKHGVMVSGVFQEIDIASGKLLYEWDSLDHIPITHSEQAFAGGVLSNPWDYFHINSLQVTPDGKHVYVGSRNTWAFYKVERNKNGKVVQTIGGRHSDFKMGPGSQFYFQHHVRWHGNGDVFSVFDNGASPVKEKQSRAIVLDVDFKKHHVSLRHQYFHPHLQVSSAAMGSAQLLPDGRMFVGWGTNPFFNEFHPGGSTIVAGTQGRGNASYRMFTYDWEGHPTDPPDVVVHHKNGKALVYVSWNGATNVHSWVILAGKSRSKLKPVATARRSGFETAAEISNTGPFFAVRARDAKGQTLSTSKTVKIS